MIPTRAIDEPDWFLIFGTSESLDINYPAKIPIAIEKTTDMRQVVLHIDASITGLKKSQ